MDLVNPEEREQLRRRIIEKITPDVADLFVSETERILKECYNLSHGDLAKEHVFSEPGLSKKAMASVT
jgi:hypothetical protein